MNILKNKKISEQNGFITMLSVLVFGVVALAIASSVLLIGLGTSRTGFVIEQSSQAKSLANLCGESALREIRNSTSFVGADTFIAPVGSCTYNVTDNGGENRTITAEGTVGTIVRKIFIAVDQINPSINIASWQEIP